jgi:hypothetical protein
MQRRNFSNVKVNFLYTMFTSKSDQTLPNKETNEWYGTVQHHIPKYIDFLQLVRDALPFAKL